MNYISLPFFLFLPILVGIYYIVNAQYRYIVLFFGSYIFYGYSNPRMLVAMVIVTIISFWGGTTRKRHKISQGKICSVLLG